MADVPHRPRYQFGPRRWTWTSRHSREHNIKYPYNCQFGQDKRQKIYAVANGRHLGIYCTWAEANWLVDEFSGARHESFKSLAMAKLYLQQEVALFPPLPPPTHRIHYEFRGHDKENHKVFECLCCTKIFCTSGKDVVLY